MGFIEDVQLAEWNLQQANAAYRSRVEEAGRHAAEILRAYEAKVAALERQVQFINRPISSVGRIKLYADRVTDGEMTIFLQRGVDARVNVGGNTSNTRVNNRRTILTIDSPDGTRLVAVGSQSNEKHMHEFAALVMNTAAEIEGEPVPTEVRLAQLEQELATARADTREVDAAQAAYAAAYNDTGAVWAAQQALDALKARAPQADVAAYEGAKQRKRLRDRTIAIVAAALVVAVVLGFLGLIFIGWLYR